MRLSLSVIIPVHNRSREVNAALASLVEEAMLIDEVVVVDDHSTVPVMLDVPAALAGRVRLLRLPANQGASGARQAGVTASSGDLIAFLDSDDAWLPGKLAAQLPLLRSGDPMLAVTCGWQDVPMLQSNRISRSSVTRMPCAASDPILFASGCWFCPGATSIVTREAFRRVGPLDSRLRRLEDLDWFLRFALQGGRLDVAHFCGALVAWTPRSNFTDVDDASRIVQNKFDVMPDIDPQIHSRLEAWLGVERAKAHWMTSHHRQPWAAVKMLAASYWRHPRRHWIQMEDWWTIHAPTMSHEAALERLGLRPAQHQIT
jgi:glycosyltransferase involved in cell wall biosynthesis